MEQKNQEQKMEEQTCSSIIKFGMNYIIREEETIKLPKHANIIKVDTVNGIPTLFWKASEHGGITETVDVTIGLLVHKIHMIAQNMNIPVWLKSLHRLVSSFSKVRTFKNPNCMYL